MTQIRKMCIQEAEKVLDLWNENSLEAAHTVLSVNEATGVLTSLKQYASHQEAFCLVAEDSNKLVAFLTGCSTSHPILEGLAGEIEELFVQPKQRRQGIGSALVIEAVSMLRQAGASTIRVHACAESPVALGFWQSLGWEQDLSVYSLYQ